MLARAFKTPQELGLDDAEHSALVKVLGMLERGELTTSKGSEGEKPKNYFDMVEWCHCICGWARKVSHNEALFKQHRDSADSIVHMLFVGFHRKELKPITTDDAARAVSNYLTTGVVDWS